MKYRILVPTALSILSLFGSATSQDSGAKQNNVAERVQRLMDVEMGFSQMVPAGMSIEAKEISRNIGEGGLRIAGRRIADVYVAGE